MSHPEPQRHPRIVSYVRLLVVFVLAIAVAAVAFVYRQGAETQELSETALNYHRASSHHGSVIARELLRIRASFAEQQIAATTGAPLRRPRFPSSSFYVIRENVEELAKIQARYGAEPFAGVLTKLKTELDRGLELGQAGYPTDHARARFDVEKIETMVVATEQLVRLHEIANERISTRLIELQAKNVQDLGGFVVFALLSSSVVFFLVFRSIRSVLERQRETERSLFREKEELKTTFQSMGEGVATTDEEGRVTYLNPVAEKLTEWANDTARGLPLEEVVSVIDEPSAAPFESTIAEVLKLGTVGVLADHPVLTSRSGKQYPIEATASPIRTERGAIGGLVLVFRDDTQTRTMVRQMSWQATHDELTGLLNRYGFEKELEALLSSRRPSDPRHALLYIDLDQFKLVNDTCGHSAGDELLRQLTSLLKSEVRDADVVARLGGDEFGILLEGITPEKAYEIAERIRATVQSFRFVWEQRLFTIGLSIGLVPIGSQALDRGEALRIADVACYAAKEAGRNRVQIYLPDDEQVSLRQGEMEWVSKINDALERGRFRLYRQRIVPLGGESNGGSRFEVLLRMLNENDELVPPAAFLPAAERYNLMPAIDRWVVRKTSELLTTNGTADVDFYSINLSGHSIADASFLDFVDKELTLGNLAAERLCFEVTETAAISNFAQAMHFMASLRKRGCRFALDDFGSGLSSFGYLKNLAVDYLKIDGSFVRDMLDDPLDRAMVESINHIGHTMSMQTVAEFVEDADTAAALLAMGIDYGQGYGLGRPEPF